MDSIPLDAVTNELRNRLNTLTESINASKAELTAKEDEILRIKAALAALSGSAPKAASNGAQSKPSRRKAQTPSPKKADVIAAMKRVLEKERAMDSGELKKRVEATLAEAGFNRFGFAMRWNEAIQDSQFNTTQKGVQLVEENAPTSDGELRRALSPREVGSANDA